MSIPKEPRQLMINLMYLVLTAMLALNITKEVLTAFATINGSIESTNGTIIKKNNEFYDAFDKAELTSDSAKVRPFNEAAKRVKAQSEQTFTYLQSWKDSVIQRSGGYETQNGVQTIKALDDINTPTKMFVEEKKGDEIKKRLTDYVEKILAEVKKPADNERIRKQIPLRLLDYPTSEENPSGNWSHGTFNNIPVVASIAMFSKFQNDVKNAESMVLDYLNSQVYIDAIKIDAFVPIATPNTSYALEGQEIEASIVLAAYNKSVNPRMSSSAGAVNVKEGIGTLKIKASGAGVKTVNGVITMEANGVVTNYPYKFQYTVGSAGASLQLDKMNVMYIGVPNPVTLSASGYNIEDVTLSMPGADVKSTGKGTYTVNVSKQGTLEYSINASRGGQGGGKISGGKIRVKYIPAPQAMVGGITSGRLATATAKAQRGVIAKLEGFDFDTRFDVVSFRFAYIPRNGEYGEAENNGAVFGNTVRAFMDRSRAGDKWIFENIKAKGPDGRVQTINSVTITLN
jgi:gliding motility-associated protein GldM